MRKSSSISSDPVTLSNFDVVDLTPTKTTVDLGTPYRPAWLSSAPPVGERPARTRRATRTASRRTNILSAATFGLSFLDGRPMKKPLHNHYTIVTYV